MHDYMATATEINLAPKSMSVNFIGNATDFQLSFVFCQKFKELLKPTSIWTFFNAYLFQLQNKDINSTG